MDFAHGLSEFQAAHGDHANPFMAFRRFADEQLAQILQSFVDLPASLSSKLHEQMEAYDKEIRRRAQHAYDTEIQRQAQEAYEQDNKEQLRHRAAEKWASLSRTAEGKRWKEELVKTRSLATDGIPKEHYLGSGQSLDEYVTRGVSRLEKLSGRNLDSYITGGGWLHEPGKVADEGVQTHQSRVVEAVEQGPADSTATKRSIDEPRPVTEGRASEPDLSQNLSKAHLEQTKHHYDPAVAGAEMKGLGIIATLTTTERIILPDGAVHTKMVLKKRFADGREESNETVHTAREGQEHASSQAKKSDGSGGWFWT
jgi:hypothetical protein